MYLVINQANYLIIVFLSFYLSESNDTTTNSSSPNFPTITILPPIYKLLDSTTPNLPKIEITPPLCRIPLYNKNSNKNSSSTSNIPDRIASSSSQNKHQEDYSIPNLAHQKENNFCIPRSRTMSQIKGTKELTNQNLKMAAASNSNAATYYSEKRGFCLMKLLSRETFQN